jgi:hypothetical protein
MKFDLKCTEHSRYQGRIYPRSKCKACLILYWLKNGGKAVVDYTQKRGFVFLETK